MNIEPYLFFAGRCEEALEFYGNALGAKVDMKMRFNEPVDPPLHVVLKSTLIIRKSSEKRMAKKS